MNPPPTPKSTLLKITSSDKRQYSLKLSIISDKLEFSISSESLISISFKLAMNLEDLHKSNSFFRQFDSVVDIYDFLLDIEKVEEKINILLEDKFAKLIINNPQALKTAKRREIEIMVPAVDIKDKDLIIKLCEKVEKINVLEKKINYIFTAIGKTEEDFDSYEQLKSDFINNNKLKDIESKIITKDDFFTVAVGIKNKLNKTIKEARLLYRASRDGDSTQFHTKCDGRENTVTFVKAKNGRKFGGFANKAFHSSNGWISDPNCFVFSLNFQECYYYKTNDMICGSNSNGPLWGSGYDLHLASGCLSNTSSSTSQSSFEYYGKSNALSGSTNFQAEDYETYELILE